MAFATLLFSILMPAEQGKLSLQDEIQKFLPDFPTQDRMSSRKGNGVIRDKTRNNS